LSDTVPQGGHQLGTRLAVGGLATAAVSGLFWMDAHREGHLGLLLLTLAAVPMALAEFYALAERLGHHPMHRLGILLGAALTALHWASFQPDLPEGLHWLPKNPAPLCWLLLLALCFLALLRRPMAERKMEDVALTLLGWAYLWLPISYGILLRTEPAFAAGGTLLGGLLGTKADTGQAGQAALAFALAAAKGSDIVAYFVGSRLGRNPLAPTVSPKKTWEGLGGAVIGGALFGWGVAHWWPALPAGELPAAVLGGLIGLVGQFSDLCESALKRQASVKDSGNIPALGGMLDMVDSLLLALPVAYYGLVWIHARPL